MLTVLHHNDADGFGAAYAIWTVMPDAVCIPVQYNQPVPEIPAQTTDLMVVDFSYDRQTLENLATKYKLVVLDHHKTAQQDLEGLPYAHFDLSKSGCRMAWEHTWFNVKPLPDILRYVEDRDLWKFELPFSEEVNLYIASLPWDFEVWDNFVLDTAIAAGKAIKAFRDNQIQSILKNVRRMQLTVNGCRYEVPVVNATANISEVGNEMCKAYPEAPFSASYCDRLDVRSWSLRSIGDFDVSAVAKEFGGGGHRNAAGFPTELGWPMTYSEAFLKGFEEV